MNDERLKLLYGKLQSSKLYTKSYEDFVSDYSSERSQAWLWNELYTSKLTTESEGEWLNYYFPKEAKVEPKTPKEPAGTKITPPWEKEPTEWGLPKEINPVFQAQKNAYDRFKSRRGEDFETSAHVLAFASASQYTKDELTMSRTPMEAGLAEYRPEGQKGTMKNYEFDLSALRQDMDDIVTASGFLTRQLDEKYGADWSKKQEARIAQMNQLSGEIEKIQSKDTSKKQLVERYNTLLKKYEEAPTKALQTEIQSLANAINTPTQSEKEVQPLIEQYNKMLKDVQALQDDTAYIELGKMSQLYNKQYKEAKGLISQDKYKVVADYLDVEFSVQNAIDELSSAQQAIGGAVKTVREGVDATQKEMGKGTVIDEDKGFINLTKTLAKDMAMRGAGKMLAGLGAMLEISENVWLGDKKYNSLDVMQDYLRGFAKDADVIHAAPSKFSRAFITNTAVWEPVDSVTKEKKVFQVDFDDNGNIISVRDSGGFKVDAMLSEEQKAEISKLKRETQTNWYTAPFKSAEALVDLGYMAVGARLAAAPIQAAGGALIGAAGRSAAVAGIEGWAGAAAKSYALTKNAQIASTLGTMIGVSVQMADPLYSQGLELFNGDKTKAAQFAAIVGPAIGLSSSVLGIEAIIAGKNPLLQTVLSRRAASLVDDVYNPQVAASQYIKGVLANAISETAEETIVESLITNGTAAFLGAKFESPFEDMKEFAETAVISAITGVAFSSVSELGGQGDMKYASLLAGIEMGDKFDNEIEKSVKNGIIKVPEPLQQDFISKQRIRVQKLREELTMLAPQYAPEQKIELLKLLDQRLELNAKFDALKKNGTPLSLSKVEKQIIDVNKSIDKILGEDPTKWTMNIDLPLKPKFLPEPNMFEDALKVDETPKLPPARDLGPVASQAPPDQPIPKPSVPQITAPPLQLAAPAPTEKQKRLRKIEDDREVALKEENRKVKKRPTPQDGEFYIPNQPGIYRMNPTTGVLEVKGEPGPMTEDFPFVRNKETGKLEQPQDNWQRADSQEAMDTINAEGFVRTEFAVNDEFNKRKAEALKEFRGIGPKAKDRSGKNEMPQSTPMEAALGKRVVRYNKVGRLVRAGGQYFIEPAGGGEKIPAGNGDTLFDNDIRAYEDDQLNFISPEEIYIESFGEGQKGFRLAGINELEENEDGEFVKAKNPSVVLQDAEGNVVTIKDPFLSKQIRQWKDNSEFIDQGRPDATKQSAAVTEIYNEEDLEDVEAWAEEKAEALKKTAPELSSYFNELAQTANRQRQLIESGKKPVAEVASITEEGTSLETMSEVRKFALKVVAGFNAFFGSSVNVVTNPNTVRKRLSQPDAIASGRLMFIGPVGVSNAQMVIELDKLEEARRMESQYPDKMDMAKITGADTPNIVSREEFIFHLTGWFKFPDGKWRKELPPGFATFKPDAPKEGTVKLTDLMEGRIFELYPSLKDATVQFKPMGTSGAAVYRLAPTDKKTIDLDGKEMQVPVKMVPADVVLEINSDYPVDSEMVQKTILHEVQHIVQAVEGFGLGSRLDPGIRFYDPVYQKKVADAEQRLEKAKARQSQAKANFKTLGNDIQEVIRAAISKAQNKEVAIENTYDELVDYLFSGTQQEAMSKVFSEIFSFVTAPVAGLGDVSVDIVRQVWHVNNEVKTQEQIVSGETPMTNDELFNAYFRVHGEVEARLAETYPNVKNPIEAFNNEAGGEAIVIGALQGEYDVSTMPRMMKTPEGVIYGMFDPKTNTVFIDPDKITPEVTLHEMSEAWLNLMEVRYPELFEKGISLVRGTAYEDNVRNTYSHLTEEKDILREALAQAIANEGMLLLNDKREGLLGWLKDMWKTITEWAGILKTPDAVANMTLDEFVSLGAGSIVFADRLADPQQVAFIEDYIKQEDLNAEVNEITEKLSNQDNKIFNGIVNKYKSFKNIPPKEMGKMPDAVRNAIALAQASGMDIPAFKTPPPIMPPVDYGVRDPKGTAAAFIADAESHVRQVYGDKLPNADMGVISQFNALKSLYNRFLAMKDFGGIARMIPTLFQATLAIKANLSALQSINDTKFLKEKFKGLTDLAKDLGPIIEKDLLPKGVDIGINSSTGATNEDLNEAFADVYASGHRAVNLDTGIAVEGKVENGLPYLEIIDIGQNKRIRIENADLLNIYRITRRVGQRVSKAKFKTVLPENPNDLWSWNMSELISYMESIDPVVGAIYRVAVFSKISEGELKDWTPEEVRIFRLQGRVPKEDILQRGGKKGRSLLENLEEALGEIYGDDAIDLQATWQHDLVLTAFGNSVHSGRGSTKDMIIETIIEHSEKYEQQRTGDQAAKKQGEAGFNAQAFEAERQKDLEDWSKYQYDVERQKEKREERERYQPESDSVRNLLPFYFTDDINEMREFLETWALPNNLISELDYKSFYENFIDVLPEWLINGNVYPPTLESFFGQPPVFEQRRAVMDVLIPILTGVMDSAPTAQQEIKKKLERKPKKETQQPQQQSPQAPQGVQQIPQEAPQQAPQAPQGVQQIPQEVPQQAPQQQQPLQQPETPVEGGVTPVGQEPIVVPPNVVEQNELTPQGRESIIQDNFQGVSEEDAQVLVELIEENLLPDGSPNWEVVFSNAKALALGQQIEDAIQKQIDAVSNAIRRAKDGAKKRTGTDAGDVPGGPEQEPGRAAGGNVRNTKPGIVSANQEASPEPKQYISENDYPLAPEQQRAVNLILTQFLQNKGKGFLLADGTGVGKTRQILAAAAEYAKRTGKKVLIISQNKQILDANFANDAKAMGIDMSMFEVGTYNDIQSGKVGKGQYGMIVYDEAHGLKNFDTGKASAARNIKTDHTLYVTATPMDGPAKSAYFISQVTGMTESEVYNLLGFEVKISKDPKTGEETSQIQIKQGTDPITLKARLVKLRDQMIAAGAMIRREFPFWGNIIETKVNITSEQRSDEQEIWDYYEAKMEDASWAMKKSLGGQRSQDLSWANEATKINYVFQQALKDLQAGKQVVIIAEGVGDKTLKGLGGRTVPGFLETIGKMFEENGISVARIYGDNNKTEANRAFQSGEVKVVIGTSKSASTGIDLDDQTGNTPRKLYMVTPPYAGDTFQQILGRVSRRNTKSPAEIDLVFNNSSSDTRRKEIINSKLTTLRAIQDGRIEDEFDFEGLAPKKAAMEIVSISPNEFIIKGDTYVIKNQLKELGGKWDRNHGGWRFPKSKEDNIRDILFQGDVGFEDAINAAAKNGGVKASNVKDLYNVGRQVFGLSRIKAFTQAVLSDRMIGEMARRNGVTKQEMYDKLSWQKLATEGRTEETRGAVKIMEDGSAVIFAISSPDVTTPLHELAHVYESYLTSDERAAIMKWAGDKEWSRNTSEAFARGFEKYLSEGISPIKGLEKVFKKFKDWLWEIYSGIKGSPVEIELTDTMRNIYTRMFGMGDAPQIPTYRTPEQIELEAKIKSAEGELARLENTLKRKRRELDKGLVDDQPDLSGERASQVPGLLFDERADNAARDAALEPFIRAVESARENVKRLRGQIIDARIKPMTLFQSQATAQEHANGDLKDLNPTELGFFGKGFMGIRLSKVAKANIKEFFEKFIRNTFTPQSGLNKFTWSRNLKRMGFINAQMKKAEMLSKQLKKAIEKEYYIPTVVAGKVIRRSAPADMDRILRDVDMWMKSSFLMDKDATIRLAKFMEYGIPIEVGEALFKMRKHVDGLSNELLNLGIVDGNMAYTILHNMDSYLTRSYQVHDDKNWLTKVQDGPAWNKAKNWLRQGYEKEAELNRKSFDTANTHFEKAKQIFITSNGPKTKDRALKAMDFWRDRMIKLDSKYAELESKIANENGKLDAELTIMVKQQQDVFDAGRIATKGKLGEKEMGILKERKNIPEALRELYGEYKNPEVNYMKTIFKQIHLIENQKFLEDVMETGLEQGWLKTAPEAGFDDFISLGEDKLMSPLNNFYTSKVLAEAFKEYNTSGTEMIPVWLAPIVGLMNSAKFGATILSHTTQLVNFFSGTFLMWNNGHYVNPVVDIPLALTGKANKDFQEAWDLAWTETGFIGSNPQSEAKVVELYENGLIGQGVTSAEINQLLKEFKSSSERWFEGEGYNKVMNSVDGFLDSAQRIYAFGDNFWKILMYSLERNRMAKLKYGSKYEDLTEANKALIDDVAAERVRNQTPTYDYIPKNIKIFRYLPVSPSFISWPWESTRTYINSWKNLYKDATTKTTYTENGVNYAYTVAARRLLGLSATTVGLYALRSIMQSYWGYDDDDEEALRDSKPPWAENSIAIVINRNGPQYTYIDANKYVPNGYLLSIMEGLTKDSQSLGEKIKQTIKATADPFLGLDMTVMATVEAILNVKNIGKEQKIVSPDEAAGLFYETRGGVPTIVATGGFKRIAHALEPFVPGTLKSLNRLQKSIFDPQLAYTGKLNPFTEGLSNATGLRISNADAETAVLFIAKSLAERKFSAKQIFSQEEKKQKYKMMPDFVKEQFLAPYRASSEASYYRVMNEASRKYHNALKLGADPDKLKEYFTKGGEFNVREFEGIESGLIDPPVYRFEQED